MRVSNLASPKPIEGPSICIFGATRHTGCYQRHGRRKLADSLWFDKPVLSSIEGLTMSGLPIPRVLSPSKDPQSVFSELPAIPVATSATADENWRPYPSTLRSESHAWL